MILEEAVDEVRLTATEETLGERLLDAYQALQWISFLGYTRKPLSMVKFQTQVTAYLNEEGWRFRTEQSVNAQSESQTVDFVISDAQVPTYMDIIDPPQ